MLSSRPLRTMVVLTTLVIAGLSASTPAQIRDHDRAHSAVRAGEVLPLRKILRMIRSQHSGRVLDVKLTQGNAEPMWRYHVKLLDEEGRGAVIAVDGRTGQILGQP